MFSSRITLAGKQASQTCTYQRQRDHPLLTVVDTPSPWRGCYQYYRAKKVAFAVSVDGFVDILKKFLDMACRPIIATLVPWNIKASVTE